jgi:hypothetical protein
VQPKIDAKQALLYSAWIVAVSSTLNNLLGLPFNVPLDIIAKNSRIACFAPSPIPYLVTLDL